MELGSKAKGSSPVSILAWKKENALKQVLHNCKIKDVGVPFVF